MAVFKCWPMYGVQIAFRNYNPIDGFSGSLRAGMDNFVRFIHSYQFGQGIGNTLWIAVLGLLIAFLVPIILALVVNQLQSERFKKFIQTVLYSPAFIATVVVVGIMFVLLSPRSGLINNAIKPTGGELIFFMDSPEWFRPAYVISDVWQNSGFSRIVYLAAPASSDFGPANATAGVWECLNLYELPHEADPTLSKWVLTVNMNPGRERWIGRTEIHWRL